MSIAVDGMAIQGDNTLPRLLDLDWRNGSLRWQRNPRTMIVCSSVSSSCTESTSSVPNYPNNSEQHIHERHSPWPHRPGYRRLDRASFAPPHHPVLEFPEASLQRQCPRARVFHYLRGDRYLRTPALR